MQAVSASSSSPYRQGVGPSGVLIESSPCMFCGGF